MRLAFIRDTVQKVAEAITAALDIETEIVDDGLEIIGGTGRYTDKIGTYEEMGDLNSNFIYARLLKTGAEYICSDPASDPLYKSGRRGTGGNLLPHPAGRTGCRFDRTGCLYQRTTG
jgi:hypothetical protein